MEDNIFIKSFIILLIAFTGLLAGIIIGPNLGHTAIQIILIMGILTALAAVYSAIKIYISRQRRILKTSGGKEVGFIVDTFHELVGRLKEKEKELARLKSLADERAGRIEAYNENILQSVPSGVVSVDNSIKIKSFNEAAECILGIDANNAIDRNFNDVFDESLSALLKEDKPVTRAEYPYVAKDKRHIWLGVTTSRLKNASGEVIGIIFIFTDLTDVKLLQEQVKLKERLSQLGEMSAGISHELRNSMSVISGYAKLLNRKVCNADKALVDSIGAEIKNMDMIISELLAFAKPTVLNMTTVNLNRLIEETTASVLSDNNSIGVTLDTGEQIFIKADETLLRQALTNLLINAVESMSEGGSLEIRVNSIHGALHGSAAIQERAVISIKDTGKGIPDDIKDKIFLPFYTTKERGIGLGLALVQKIIVSHNGSIEIESREGRGTTFKITLPAASQLTSL